MNKLIIACLLALVVAGCGRKGPLINPDALRTPAVSDLQAVQKGDHFQVSWSKPAAPATNKQVADVAVFKVLRREVFPPAQDCEECTDAYHVLKTVDIEFPKEVVIRNGRYIISDFDLIPGRIYQYKLVSILKDNSTALDSNKARRKMLLPPTAPTLHLTPTSTSIGLEWTQPASAPGSAPLGYNIYRSETGKESALLPLNSVPITDTRYEDLKAQRNVSYRYTVRAVLTMDKETVESIPSNEMTGTLAAPEF